MVDFIRPVLARIVGAAVAGLLTFLANKYGVIIPKETAGQVTTAVVTAIVTMFTIIYAIVHKWLDNHANPTDAANPTLARRAL